MVLNTKFKFRTWLMSGKWWGPDCSQGQARRNRRFLKQIRPLKYGNSP